MMNDSQLPGNIYLRGWEKLR